MRKDKLLQGEKVFLRPLNAADQDTYYTMFFDSEVRRLTGTKQAFTYAQIEQVARKRRCVTAYLLAR